MKLAPDLILGAMAYWAPVNPIPVSAMCLYRTISLTHLQQVWSMLCQGIIYPGYNMAYGLYQSV